MAVSVFPGVRLLSIGDANGDIQRHSEQQPLRLEVKSTHDAALINLSNGEFTFSRSCSSDLRPVPNANAVLTLAANPAVHSVSHHEATAAPPSYHGGSPERTVDIPRRWALVSF